MQVFTGIYTESQSEGTTPLSVSLSEKMEMRSAEEG